jgi:molybdenum cofactor guanylyltransferase
MTIQARHPDISLGILAGGAGRRFGGQDKGWIDLGGLPQIVRLLQQHAGATAAVLVSANRNVERYRDLGVEVVSDPWPDYPGPLAGVASLLGATRTPCLVTLPVDAYGLPADLIDRIASALRCCTGVVSVSDCDGPQPLFAGYPRALATPARDAFERGERSVLAWQRSLPGAVVELSGIRLGNRNQPGDGPGDIGSG